ncbi:LysR family transcriptional regulator [Streptomyces sp. BE230]|uniref:LysR family transcriptional regulator n=1 Tax=Streptomyces sp. BE230 TaxID=3002526 RepID=UPI002ED105E6|nr:LysR family transcriptional regulator [Streptomyces sp. BE230]
MPRAGDRTVPTARPLPGPLRTAQPALSQQIRKRERQLGVTLFERDKHRVELTAAGAVLLESAERILSTWLRARRRCAAGRTARAAASGSAGGSGTRSRSGDTCDD